MKSCFLLLTAAFAWAQQPAAPAPPPAAAPAQPAAPSAAAALAQTSLPPDTVVLTIGDTKITKAQFEQIIMTVPEPQRAQFNTPAGKKRMAEQLAELEALAQEARTRKMDQNPEVKAEVMLRVDQTLAQKLYQEFLASAKADDAALHAYYDSHKSEFEQIKAKHILIRAGATAPGPPKPDEKTRTDAEALALANDLHAKLVAGANFDELAKAYSDDTANAKNGGELGTFEHGRMVPQFEKAAFAAEVGKVTEPVKTQFGYHLILVEEHTTKPFDAVRTQIEQKIKPEMAQKEVAELKKKANITYDDSYFGKPPTLGPPTPALLPPPAKQPGK